MDIVYLGLALGLVGLMVAAAYGCERLLHKNPGAR